MQITKQEKFKNTERRKKKAKNKDLKFASNVKEYLASKDIEIIKIIEQKKKELSALVRLDTLFGKQELYLIPKDKKKIFKRAPVGSSQSTTGKNACLNYHSRRNG